MLTSSARSTPKSPKEVEAGAEVDDTVSLLLAGPSTSEYHSLTACKGTSWCILKALSLQSSCINNSKSGCVVFLKPLCQSGNTAKSCLENHRCCYICCRRAKEYRPKG